MEFYCCILNHFFKKHYENRYYLKKLIKIVFYVLTKSQKTNQIKFISKYD